MQPGKKAAEGNTEKLEKKVQDLQGKVKAKKAFIEEQNNIQKTAHANSEKMKSAEALRQNLRAAELARMTVERRARTSTTCKSSWLGTWARSQRTPEWLDK